MEAFIDLFNNLLDPDWIMDHGGLFLVLLIIFAETGLFIGFFLPGDPMLFVTGMVIAGAEQNAYPFESGPINLVFWISLLITAAVLGNFLGYWFGRKSGHLLFERKESWLFKRKHLEAAHDFYEKKGGFAIMLARFLPVVRTFAPIIAGVVKMDFKKFAFYNIAGAFIWVISITTLGYLLGGNIWVKENLEYIILAIVLITTGPVLFKMFIGKKKTTPTVTKKRIEEAVF